MLLAVVTEPLKDLVSVGMKELVTGTVGVRQ